MRRAALGALVASAALISACNGGGSPSRGYAPGPSVSPSASTSPTPISSTCPMPPAGSVIYANPNPISIHVTQNQVITICEAGYTGSFSVTSSNTSMCVITPLGSNNSWNLYGAFAGNCSVNITDRFGNLLQVPVTIG